MRKNQRKPDASGIELIAPRLTGKEPSSAVTFLFSTLLVLLGVFGAAWCFISVFSPPVLPLTTVLYSLLSVAAVSAVFHLKWGRPCPTLALFAVFLAAGYYLRSDLVQGFLITTNQIMRTYASHSDYVLPIYNITAKPAEFSLMSTVFILYSVLFLTFLLCWAIIRRQSAGAAFLFTVPFPTAALIFNISPNLYGILMLISCWVLLLFMRLSGGKRQGFLKTRKTYRAKSHSAAAKAGLQLIPAVLLSFALILAVFPEATYQYSPNAQTLRYKLIDNLSRISDYSFLDNGDSLAGSSDHVNLKGADSVRFTGRTMLQVQADPAYPTYLKGFTGSIYTGTSWEPLPDSDYTEIDPKLSSFNVQNMSATLFRLIGPQPSIDLAPFRVQVKNTGANKKIIYTPYNLTTDPKSITGVKFIHDDSIRSSWLFGTNDYTMYANSFNGEHISSNVPGVFLALSEKYSAGGATLNDTTRGLWSYYKQDGQMTLFNPNNVRTSYTDPIPDELMNTLTGDGKAFIEEDQDYRLFLYDKYTQLPQGIKEKLQTLLQEQRIIGGYTLRDSLVTRSSASTYGSISHIIDAVKIYLAQTCTYTLTPGRTPAGQDFTDYFLFQNHKGYCVHFATAATVLLRAMGVPARYAEGYIVTDSDYKNAVSGWANVKDNRAHAWVEVYYPGLGWQPVEVTPGFNVEQNQTQDDLPQTESSVSSTPAESAVSSSAASAVESQTASSNTQSTVSQSTSPIGTRNPDDVIAAALPILIAIAVLILLRFAALLKRWLVFRHREKLFTQPDSNKAALAIYRYMEKLARFGGTISEEATDIALKARFSLHTVTPEELAFLRDDAKMLAHLNLSCASKAEKFLMKYIYNLI